MPYAERLPKALTKVWEILFEAFRNTLGESVAVAVVDAFCETFSEAFGKPLANPVASPFAKPFVVVFDQGFSALHDTQPCGTPPFFFDGRYSCVAALNGTRNLRDYFFGRVRCAYSR